MESRLEKLKQNYITLKQDIQDLFNTLKKKKDYYFTLEALKNY